MVVANCVLCVFHRERTSEELATYRSCFLIPVESVLLLLVPATSALFNNLKCCAFHECYTNRHCCAFYCCTIHQLQWCAFNECCNQSTLLRLLQVHHSPISSVMPSTRVAPISTLAPSTSVAPIVTVALLQLHCSTVLLHLLTAIVFHVIMLLDNSILSLILLPMWICLVNYLTASSKSTLLQLQNMLPPFVCRCVCFYSPLLW